MSQISDSGASRRINKTMNTIAHQKTLEPRLPVCQSAINFVKIIIVRYFELMNLLKPLAFEIFVKLTEFVDIYVCISFLAFLNDSNYHKLFSELAI